MLRVRQHKKCIHASKFLTTIGGGRPDQTRSAEERSCSVDERVDGVEGGRWRVYDERRERVKLAFAANKAKRRNPHEIETACATCARPPNAKRHGGSSIFLCTVRSGASLHWGGARKSHKLSQFREDFYAWPCWLQMPTLRVPVVHRTHAFYHPLRHRLFRPRSGPYSLQLRSSALLV
jgi:hypothetical protein